MSIRALVADDEPLARERIATLLRDEPDVELVGECADGPSAVDAIRQLSPHLVFLDVQMPSGDGFSVMDRLGSHRLPLVIFVTAYDEHAIRAFEVHAFDYLLKPFDADRFRRALARARDELAQVESRRLAREAMALASGGREPVRPARLVIKGSGRVYFLATRDIDWIEAAGNYLKLHVNGDSHMIRQTMAAIEDQLDPDLFYRIHRSTIVNIDRIKELQPLFNGEYLVILRSGARLTLSRGYREELEARLGHKI
jgi:two-component system, LytTR family, response regulator